MTDPRRARPHVPPAPHLLGRGAAPEYYGEAVYVVTMLWPARCSTSAAPLTTKAPRANAGLPENDGSLRRALAGVSVDGNRGGGVHRSRPTGSTLRGHSYAGFRSSRTAPTSSKIVNGFSRSGSSTIASIGCSSQGAVTRRSGRQGCSRRAAAANCHPFRTAVRVSVMARSITGRRSRSRRAARPSAASSTRYPSSRSSRPTTFRSPGSGLTNRIVCCRP